MSLAQISMHYIRNDFTHSKALTYMRLVGLMESEARLLLNQLDACVE